MVNLTSMYTRTGDAGETRLGDMSTTTKTDLRLRAYADVDEASAHLGLAVAQGDLSAEVVTMATRIQNDLFDVGADLCAPVVPHPEHPPLRVEQHYVDRLESWCDDYNADLPTLRSFMLSGGTPAAALLHVARTVVRRPSGRLGRLRGARGLDEPDGHHLPQPPLGPAVHPRPARQQECRRRALGSWGRALTATRGAARSGTSNETC